MLYQIINQMYSLKNRRRYVNALEVKVRSQLLQLGNVVNLATKLGANERSKELQDDANKAGRVNDKQFLQVLLVLPVKGSIGLPEPPKGGLILAS